MAVAPGLKLMDLESSLKAHKELLIGRWVTDLANTAAFIFSITEGINWAGFYLFEDGMLVLGPFQGKPACTTIALDRGVCGASASRKEVLVVPDVHAFPGHISCDPASRSEIVVPMIAKDRSLLGVLDVDSPLKGRFTDFEREFFSRLVAQLLARR
ncbi:MAG: GAF domain-containing protein [Elusimicrobia bacterium]|nr:GAF domain-containing protein [Elusimicrobiota bacterium]